MPKITVRRDGALVTSFTVHDKTFAIGSAQNSAIYIDDVGLPPQAAEISAGESGYTLKRLSPIPDLRVNGERVDQYAEVADLDEIKLDDYILNFNLLDEELAATEPEAAAEPAEAAQPAPPAEVKPPAEAAPAEPEAAAPASPEPAPPPPPAAPEVPAPAPPPPVQAAAPPPAPVPPPPPAAPEPPRVEPPKPEPPRPEPPKPAPPQPEPPPAPPEPPAYPKTVMQEVPPPAPPPPAPRPAAEVPKPAPQPPPPPPKPDSGRKTKVLDDSAVPAAKPPAPKPAAAPPKPSAPAAARPVSESPAPDHEATQFAGHALTERLALLAIGGPIKGERFILKEGETRIGRDPNQNDIVIRFDSHGDVDTSISRQHCTITNQDGVYMLRDPKSKTRTMHNGRVLKPEDAVALKQGDTVEVRSLHENTSFRVVREGEWDAPERTLKEDDRKPHGKAPWWKRFLPVLAVGLCLAIAGVWWTAGASPDRRVEVTFETAAPWPAPAGIKSATGAFLTLGDSVVLLVYADTDGNLQWWHNGEAYRSATLGLSASEFPFLALDVNRDGNQDVILGSDDHHLYYYDGSRGSQLGVTEWFVEPFGTPPSATWSARPAGLVAVHSDRGGLAVYKAANAATFRSGAYYNGRTFGAGVFLDCNADGVEDYVAGTDDGQINWIDGTSGEMETVDVRDAAVRTMESLEASALQVRGAVAGWDFTADGYADWVVLTRQGHLMIIDRHKSQLLALHVFPAGREGLPTRYPGPLLADLDKDGIPEIIVAHYSGTLHALRVPRQVGGPFSEFWPAARIGAFKYEPALVDLNGDRSPEVVACDAEGVLIVLDGATGESLYRAELGLSGFPLAGDVDGDGEVEIAAAAGSQWAVVRTGVKADAGPAWLQWRGDIGHHGAYATPAPRSREPWTTTIILGVLALAAVIFWVKL